MKHALVIGGTGMLAGVSRWLAAEGYHVSVVGRNNEKMNLLINSSKVKSSITPLLVDYTNKEELKRQIISSIIKNGEIEMCILWVHPYAKEALHLILNELAVNRRSKIFHILNSRANLEQTLMRLSLPNTCLYRQIQLGFVVNCNSSRWLTHAEISCGVIDAIKTDSLTYRIGVTEPWEKRPRITKNTNII